ncbi:tetraacyldisaccharide 4'-kinase [Elongatibacter sediminis]|uniref:Tetraacyldisaccharide 4'-kinase n=1 Tax=Elongatibacter sediminis TaxID=3119006 RepID=A0AAW9R9A4_9GAMM
MRGRIESWLNGIWYGAAEAPWWLRALAPVYRVVFLTHRAIGRYRRPPDLLNAPIVVVGNLTAGGSGKTPLVIRLCQVLREAGLKPGIVSRGYGGRRRGVVRVSENSSAAVVGDEALLMAGRTGLPVAVGSDRCAAARSLLAGGADVIVTDDGLQHHRLPRTLEICVVDAQRQFGNGRLLPAGPLREPVERLRRVDHVVVNTADPLAEPRLVGAVAMQLLPGPLRSLDDRESWRISQFAGCRANAVAGIGNPERFFRVLEQAGLKLNRYVFPDHHRYVAADLERLEPGLPLIMTEKDAVKCRGMGLENAWYLSIDASLPARWEGAIAERMLQAVTPA